jgi:hypothetical protein
MKMEQIECSGTSAYKIQTPGNCPEENIQHTKYIIILFHGNIGYTNAPQCYVMPTFCCPVTQRILLYHPLASGSQRKALVSSYEHATKGSRTIRGRCTGGESMGLISVVTYSAEDCAWTFPICVQLLLGLENLHLTCTLNDVMQPARGKMDEWLGLACMFTSWLCQPRRLPSWLPSLIAIRNERVSIVMAETMSQYLQFTQAFSHRLVQRITTTTRIK